MCVCRASTSWLLRTAVLALLTPIVSGGEFAGGSGEPNDPYQIATAQQLISIGDDPNLLDRHFVLISDVHLYESTPGGYLFRQAMIAPDTRGTGAFKGNSFSGTFDGGSHVIRGLSIHNPGGLYLGLFGAIGQRGVVTDLVVEGANVGEFGRYRRGIIAGWNRGRIAHCVATGVVSGSGELGILAGVNSGEIIGCQTRGKVFGQNTLGGLVGVNTGLAIVDNSHASARIFALHDPGQRAWAGGLAGVNKGSITDSHASGSIFGIQSQYIGGLVGEHGYGGTVARCCASSEVSVLGQAYAIGGLVGAMVVRGTIVDCYATGDVRSDDSSSYLGGLIGLAWGDIERCYSVGEVVAGTNSESLGGLTGHHIRGSTTASFWDIEASTLSTSDGGTGLATAEMKDAAKFVASGWDFADEQSNGTADTWFMPKEGGYPKLTWEVGDTSEAGTATSD